MLRPYYVSYTAALMAVGSALNYHHCLACWRGKFHLDNIRCAPLIGSADIDADPVKAIIHRCPTFDF